MVNYVGSGDSDPLYSDVRFLYSLRSDFEDKGPVGLADAAPNGAGVLVPVFSIFPGVGAYFSPAGNADRLSLPQFAVPNEGTGDWTLDFWIYSAAYSGPSAAQKGFFYADAKTNSGCVALAACSAISVGVQGAGETLRTIVVNTAGASNQVDGAAVLTDGVPYFVSICRNGNSIFCYLDGVLQNTISVTGQSFDFAAAADVTNVVNALGNGFFTNGQAGELADLRWTSAARYDGTTFDPPEDTLFTGDPGPIVSETLKVRAWTFPFDGHEFYVLRLGNLGTFVYDKLTQQWCNWVTSGYTVWNADHGVIEWQGYPIACDLEDPILWKIDPAASLDQGSLPLTRTVTCIIQHRERDPLTLGELRITASVGDPYQDGATITISFSDDQGNTYTTMPTVALNTDDFTQVLRFRSLGRVQSPGRYIDITDVGGVVDLIGVDVEVSGEEE